MSFQLPLISLQASPISWEACARLYTHPAGSPRTPSCRRAICCLIYGLPERRCGAIKPAAGPEPPARGPLPPLPSCPGLASSPRRWFRTGSRGTGQRPPAELQLQLLLLQPRGPSALGAGPPWWAQGLASGLTRDNGPAPGPCPATPSTAPGPLLLLPGSGWTPRDTTVCQWSLCPGFTGTERPALRSRLFLEPTSRGSGPPASGTCLSPLLSGLEPRHRSLGAGGQGASGQLQPPPHPQRPGALSLGPGETRASGR